LFAAAGAEFDVVWHYATALRANSGAVWWSLRLRVLLWRVPAYVGGDFWSSEVVQDGGWPAEEYQYYQDSETILPCFNLLCQVFFPV